MNVIDRLEDYLYQLSQGFPILNSAAGNLYNILQNREKAKAYSKSSFEVAAQLEEISKRIRAVRKAYSRPVRPSGYNPLEDFSGVLQLVGEDVNLRLRCNAIKGRRAFCKKPVVYSLCHHHMLASEKSKLKRWRVKHGIQGAKNFPVMNCVFKNCGHSAKYFKCRSHLSKRQRRRLQENSKT